MFENEIGVNVAIPNTTELKMKAILNASAAMVALCKAIDGVNTEVYIENNQINGAEIGVNIEKI